MVVHGFPTLSTQRNDVDIIIFTVILSQSRRALEDKWLRKSIHAMMMCIGSLHPIELG